MERMENKLFLMILSCFFIVLIFNVFTVTKLPLKEIAITTMQWTQIAALLGFGFIVFRRRSFDADRNLFHIGIGLFASSYIISYFLSSPPLHSSKPLFEILLVLLFVCGLAQIKWQSNHMVLFAFMCVTLFILIFIQWWQNGLPTFQFRSYIRNPNIFGVFIAVLMYFPIVAMAYSRVWMRAYFIIGLLAGIVLIYASTARSAMLLLCIAVFARVIAMFSKKLFNLLFYAVMLFNMLVVLLYSWLFKSQMLVSLNEKVLAATGKQIFSGRQEIWEPALNFGLQHPLIGHFIGVLPKDYIEGTHFVHVHNQYLQIFLESGFVGLFCFLILLYGIWSTFQKNLDSTLVTWSACFYLGILFYQSFEISLFVNMQAIGLFQWLIIAIGIGAGITIERQTRRRKI